MLKYLSLDPSCFLLEREFFSLLSLSPVTCHLSLSPFDLSGRALWPSNTTSLLTFPFHKVKKILSGRLHRGLAWRGCSNDARKRMLSGRTRRRALSSSEFGAEIYQRVTATMGVMIWDFCLPRSRKCTSCREGVTVLLSSYYYCWLSLSLLSQPDWREHSGFTVVLGVPVFSLPSKPDSFPLGSLWPHFRSNPMRLWLLLTKLGKLGLFFSSLFIKIKKKTKKNVKKITSWFSK